jgi:hypothetical protein
MSEFYATLQSWQNFYFMLGGASASLLGLMFVALSLGMNLITEETVEGARIWVNPSVFYFALALFLAAVMLIPDNSPQFIAIVLYIVVFAAIVPLTRYQIRLIHYGKTHDYFKLAEWSFQSILPVLGIIMIFVAATCFFLRQDWVAFMGMWFVMVSLVVSAIYNTWSLVMSIVLLHTKVNGKTDATGSNSTD